MHRRSVLTGLAATAICPLCAAYAAPADEYDPVTKADPEWDYSDGKKGPAHWSDLSPAYNSCGHGAQQSPIDLSNAARGGLPPLYIDYRPSPAKVENNGHTILVRVPETPRNAIAEGGNFSQKLTEFHFHLPSEHTLNGMRLPMEIHFVHVNDVDAAVTVLGVFVDSSSGGVPNAALQAVIGGVTTAKAPGGEVIVNPKDLLPQQRTRFRYIGSQTTPGCAQIVNWHIFDTPLLIDQWQIDLFSHWYKANSRPLQPLGERVLRYD
jgi:carbonic anhydrase